MFSFFKTVEVDKQKVNDFVQMRNESAKVLKTVKMTITR